MKTLAFTTALIGLSLLPSTIANTGGQPVYDAVGASRAWQQLQQMAKDQEVRIDQLDQALETYNAITGGRDLGDLLNSTLEQDLRRALPDDLQSLIGLKNASNLGTSAQQTQRYLNSLFDVFKPMSGADLHPSDPNSTLATIHDHRTNSTYSALAASESTYNLSSKRRQDYETMLSELNQTQDLKQSIDLLARISVENGLLMNELSRIQALQTQISAGQQSEALQYKEYDHKALTYDPNIAAQAFE